MEAHVQKKKKRSVFSEGFHSFFFDDISNKHTSWKILNKVSLNNEKDSGNDVSDTASCEARDNMKVKQKKIKKNRKKHKIEDSIDNEVSLDSEKDSENNNASDISSDESRDTATVKQKKVENKGKKKKIEDFIANKVSLDSEKESENDVISDILSDEPKDIMRVKQKKGKKKEIEDPIHNNTNLTEDSENAEDSDSLDESSNNMKERKKQAKGSINGEPFFCDKIKYFTDLYLSRPLIKALNEMDFIHPTPIQIATIPEALMGKDICGCAATGTGKTAAFMLPVLERLLYKPGKKPITRVLVLLPTRELAVQVYQVSRQLAQFTNIEISLSTGGLDIKAQEAAIRKIPDIIIATPGRLIDHLMNTPSFNLQKIEIIILDEADRMLDEYFAQQMKKIIQECCSQHQTMLFSATMTEQVSALSAVSLKNPVKIFINKNTEVALNLQQEFVRVRPNYEDSREGLLAALICRTFHDHTLVFAQTKKQVHRLYLMLRVLDIKVTELHGDLNQKQRLESLQQFKDETADVLIATDVAARGLDVEGVKTVINFSLPGTLQQYIHRVGRTARAGRGGRSVSLVGEKERKLLKQVRKKTNKPITQRLVPPEIISKYKKKVDGLEDEIEKLIHEEREEKVWKDTDRKVKAAEKLLNSKNANDEMERKWFQTPQERKKEQESMRLAARTKKKTGFTKQSAKDRIDHELQKAIDYSIRIAKRTRKPKRARPFSDDADQQNNKKRKHLSKTKSYEDMLGNTSKKSLKKFRYEATQVQKLEQIKNKKKLPSKKIKSTSREALYDISERFKRKKKLPHKKFKSKSRYRRKK